MDLLHIIQPQIGQRYRPQNDEPILVEYLQQTCFFAFCELADIHKENSLHTSAPKNIIGAQNQLGELPSRRGKEKSDPQELLECSHAA